MKKALNYLLVPSMIALFLLWKEGGIEGAGNIFTVLFWVLYPCALAGSFVQLAEDKVLDLPKPEPFWFRAVVIVSMFCLTAWYGHEAMVVLVLLNVSVGEAVRNKQAELRKVHKTA